MKKIQPITKIFILLSLIGVTLVLAGLHQANGTPAEEQSGLREIEQLREEWQQLADKLQTQIESNRSEQWYCCVIDPCTYCLLYQEDGRCTCAADLRAGKEPCPECLGEWINRRGAMYAWMDFQGVYPDLAGWLVGRGGPPATCPMMAGRRGGTGMMGMMRGRYDDQYTRLPESLQKMQVTLLAKSRELKELSDYNCCLKGGGSCTYCLRDVTRTAATICDCKDRLQLGQEICPECLGNWASEEWNPELKDAFQRVYPSLSRVVRPE